MVREKAGIGLGFLFFFFSFFADFYWHSYLLAGGGDGEGAMNDTLEVRAVVIMYFFLLFPFTYYFACLSTSCCGISVAAVSYCPPMKLILDMIY